VFRTRIYFNSKLLDTTQTQCHSGLTSAAANIVTLCVMFYNEILSIMSLNNMGLTYTFRSEPFRLPPKFGWWYLLGRQTLPSVSVLKTVLVLLQTLGIYLLAIFVIHRLVDMSLILANLINFFVDSNTLW